VICRKGFREVSRSHSIPNKTGRRAELKIKGKQQELCYDKRSRKEGIKTQSPQGK